MGGISPRVTTFQHYATILTEDEEYEKAISICEKAIEYGLLDNTASGFEGRIARIRKKAEKAEKENAYKLRKEEKYRKICIEYSTHIR
jgi:hypothetical protein